MHTFCGGAYICHFMDEPERVEICRIKSFIIKTTLNGTTLYFEDPGLVFQKR